jgi:purine-binding chemotaxis protein CheW
MARIPDPQEILALRRKSMTKARRATVLKTIEVVEFIMGDHNYAFLLEQIREICPVAGLAFIPGAPLFAMGVINLRGEVVPIIDLQIFMGLPTHHGGVPAFKGSDAKAIVFERGDLVVGFLADEVIGAEKIPESLLQHNVETLCGVNAEYISAVTAERMIVLNVDRLLSDARLQPKEEELI